MPARSKVVLQPALTADDYLACPAESGLALREAAETWRDLENPLTRLSPDSLRVLPGGQESCLEHRNRTSSCCLQ